MSGDFSELLGKDIHLAEALDIIFEHKRGMHRAESSIPVEALFIEPPEPGILSDEDCGDADEGGIPDNLSHAQLNAPVEVRLFTENPHFDEVPDKHHGKRNYMEGEIIPLPGQTFPNPDYSKYKDMIPPQLFELFLDKSILEMLKEESNNFALYLGRPYPDITVEELKCFVAILILSGYHAVPKKSSFWDEGEDMRNDLVVSSMTPKRFEQILRFFHCCDNSMFNINNPDKFWKIRPLIDMIKKNCLKYFIPERELSYDECMVKYYGERSCKQFIRGEPVRIGYKVWCLNTVDGYLADFDFYQGKRFGNKKLEEDFGKGTAPLLAMIQNLPKLPFRFYFNSLFTGMDLLKFLREEGYGATGTISENRIPWDCPLPSKKTFSKNKRGSFVSLISKEDGVQITRWKDHSVVTVASNCHGVKPNLPLRLFSKILKKDTVIDRPGVIGIYSKFMGGTALMDENIMKYHTEIRTKKWYWPIIPWLIDVCMHNAWTLYKKSGHDIPLLDFRRSIVIFYLTQYGLTPEGLDGDPIYIRNRG